MKTKLRSQAGLLNAAAMLLMLNLGCQTTPSVKTETKAGADFSRYRTFALLPLAPTGPASDPGLMLRLAEPARQAVVEALAAKGFTEAAREQADFSVSLHGQSLPRVEITDLGYHRTAYTRWGQVEVVERPETMVSTYDERTLSIQVFDNRSKDGVWVGWSTRAARGPVKVEAVTNAIHHILQWFPPPGASAPKS